MSKLLGIPFDIDLSVSDVDQFLATKIQKKLVYWETTRLSLVGSCVIVNSVLSSSLYYFITLWIGALKIIRQIWASLWNFLWLGSASKTRSRVRWHDVCAPKAIGGLNVIDLEKALNALMVKWIIKVFSPSESTLQIFLRFRLYKLKLDIRGQWPPSLNWALTHKFSALRGYKIWNRMITTWK